MVSVLTLHPLLHIVWMFVDDRALSVVTDPGLEVRDLMLWCVHGGCHTKLLGGPFFYAMFEGRQQSRGLDRPGSTRLIGVFVLLRVCVWVACMCV